MHTLFRFRQHVALMCAHAVLLSFIAPNMALAKGKAPLTWDNVLKLRKGDRVGIIMRSDQEHSGQVDRVEPTSIAITTKEGSLLIPRDDVSKITYLGRPRAANPGLWAMLGGVGLMAAGTARGTAGSINTARTGDFSTYGSGTGVVLAGVATAAAGLGIFVIAGRPKLIYETGR